MSNKKLENKRLQSTKKYLDNLQERYSKLNIIRNDLYYDKQFSKDITLEEANKDLERLFNNTRSKPTIFKNIVGHVVKREYTKDKGVHIHALFIFDGQKVHKDKLKAKQIGEYWSKEITKSKGAYHNCNMNEYKQSGVGILDYKDENKREILDEMVISYLCKDEQKIEDIKIDSKKKDRSFTRGIISKKKSNSGRPRKEL